MSPIEHAELRDRRGELFVDFFRLCHGELQGPAGAPARAYLQSRGFSADSIGQVDLGVVPPELFTKNALEAAGYAELEIAQSGLLADGRWPGRLCGAWWDERGRIGTFWARSLGNSDTAARYLYLRGGRRSALPPYGLADVLRLSSAERREVVLVEGLIDIHSLRADGYSSVVAVGGTRVSPQSIARLPRLGVELVVLAFDNDGPGREGASSMVDALTRTREAPTLRVLEPRLLGKAKDPDAFVRAHGISAFRALLDKADCAIRWRARELLGHIAPGDNTGDRRAALARAGRWLGSLSPRYALEQEDAVRSVADQCGYSRAAVQRAFQARYWVGSRDNAREAHGRRLVMER
jgi:DNA primase